MNKRNSFKSIKLLMTDFFFNFFSVFKAFHFSQSMNCKRTFIQFRMNFRKQLIRFFEIYVHFFAFKKIRNSYAIIKKISEFHCHKWKKNNQFIFEQSETTSISEFSMTKKSQTFSFANHEMNKFSIIKIFFIFFLVFFSFSFSSAYNHTTNDKTSNISYFDSNFAWTVFLNFHAFYILTFAHKLIFIRSKIKFSFISCYCFLFFFKKNCFIFFS